MNHTAALLGTLFICASLHGATRNTSSEDGASQEAARLQTIRDVAAYRRHTTSTVVTASVNPSVYGQPVTLTAIVSGRRSLSGSVEFFDGSASLGTATMRSTTASITIANLPVGTHSITAQYSGDRHNPGSTSAPLTLVVNAADSLAPSYISLTSSANPAQFGEPLTLSATVSAGAGTPTGTIEFLDGSTPLGTATLSAGAGSLTLSTLSAGTHSITASYSGDDQYAPSTSTFTQTIGQITTTVTALTLSSAPNPSTEGQAVIFAAQVAEAGTAGELTVFSDQVPSTYASDSLYELGTRFWTDVAGIVTHVRLYTSATEGSSHTVRIWRRNDATAIAGPYTWNIQAGTEGWKSFTLPSPVAIAANTDYIVSISNSSDRSYAAQAGGFNTALANGHLHTYAGSGVYTTNLGAMPTYVWNNSNYFRDIVFLAQGGEPTGSVDFRDGTSLIATTALANGSASFATNELMAGSHTITASYTGDANHAGSTSSIVQIVSPATAVATPTSTTLTSSANPSIEGQGVTFSATVNAASGTPTGSVQFVDGSVVIGTSTLGSGTASMTTNSLSAGAHSITASYSGDSLHLASVSPALSQVVNSSVAPVDHAVTLMWNASTSPDVAGYNVYRGSTPGGPYTRLNPSLIGATTYTDDAVQAGHVYYYVCTAVDTSNAESGNSDEAEAVVPSP